MCLLYCYEASVRAWMCRIMKELLVCCSSVAVSAVAVVWVLTVLPIRSNCSMIRSSVVWNEDSILSSTFSREDSNYCREGHGEDSLWNVVRALAITSRVGLESWALETAWRAELEILLVCGVKSTCRLSSGTAF